MDGQNGEDRVKKVKNKRMKKANIENETERKETIRQLFLDHLGREQANLNVINMVDLYTY